MKKTIVGGVFLGEYMKDSMLILWTDIYISSWCNCGVSPHIVLGSVVAVPAFLDGPIIYVVVGILPSHLAI